MMNGTAPPPPSPPPPDHITPDKDTEATTEARTNPVYNDDELWMDPPEYLPPGAHDSGKHARRSANHSAYRINGHPTIWKNYLIYGYYMYDDCHDFMKAWKATVHDRLERQRFIWREYHYRRLHGLQVSNILQNRVTEKTIPYLKEHDPDLWLASDMEYEEAMFFNDAANLSGHIKDTNNGSDSEGQWHEVSPKRRNRKSTPPSSRNSSPQSTHRSPNPSSKPTTEEGHASTMDNSDVSTPPSQPRTEKVIEIDLDETPLRRTVKPHNPYAKRTTIRHPEAMDIDQPPGIQRPSTTTEKHPDDTTQTPLSAANQTAAPEPNSNRTGTVFTSSTSTAGNGSRQQTLNTHTSPSTPINDGTFRLTVRWKPANYDDIYANQELWDTNITDTLVNVFGEFIDNINLIKWDDTTQQLTGSLVKIKESGDIRKFISPRITHLESSGQFIFGVRISMGDSTPSRWINDRRTKRTMYENSITISISNSKTNSGDVVTAGHILLKHPEFTHRTYYLMSLRRAIPETTPYFDIGMVYTTPHGEKIPHLIVKCGSNHITALTEVLSAHLDGKKTTALFLATSMLKTMTTEEAHGLFATHKHFIATIQRLPLFPQVINIDRVRTEYNATSLPTERSTREWATGLRSNDTGNLLRCDAENGGKDKRAYLLVPTAYLDQVKIEYEKYKQRLKQSGQFRNYNSQNDTTNDRPQEIYIPTAAVLRNLQFMQTMSSESIWKAAPPSVRPRHAPQHMQSETITAQPAAAAHHLPSRSHLGRSVQHHATLDPHQTAQTKSPQSNLRNSDEATTVCTTQSPLTRNTQTQSTTISALEETIQRQQQEIRNMLNRFDAMDSKMEHLTTAIKSGELNQNNTILQIQQQLDKVCTSLTFLVQQTTNNQQAQKSIHPNTQAAPQDATPMDYDTTSEHASTSLTTTTTPQRSRFLSGRSPEKKKLRSSDTTESRQHDKGNQHIDSSIISTPHNDGVQDHDLADEDKNETDQSGAQYNQPSPSDGGNPD
jgi:hypothetical protein